ncbi:MAG: DUF115 domain-containing protein [Treponema sp.]|nr:DUF115 domain-containing protein [Treponema sp.]
MTGESGKYYSFSKARSGEIVPAHILPQGEQPLHSMIDPKREAQRIVSAINKDSRFLIFLGLGGGFLPEAALELTDAYVIVIDYNSESVAELFANIDYSKLSANDRFKLLIDPSNEEIKTLILENYKPALYGGIQTIPLRTRIENCKSEFDSAVSSIHEAIDLVSGDYTVQAHFGKRWFSNIIRNIKSINDNQLINNKTEKNKELTAKYLFTPKNTVAVVAAGPSLDTQITEIAELKKNSVFIISTDTAFPVLAHNKIEADAVVSIDCQHISYYHLFTAINSLRAIVSETGALEESDKAKSSRVIPLILDIASPPMLSRFPGFTPVFFSSGHPLARLFSANCECLPVLDTSGGNVTYACLSLAEYLEAKEIIFFGADFSYVNCQAYARGTYVYPYFNKRQNRLSPLESQLSKFLYRSPFLPLENKNQNYRETTSLRFYRKKLEEKAKTMKAKIKFAKGLGAQISINREQLSENSYQGSEIRKQRTENKIQPAERNHLKFLEQYRDDINALPPAENVCGYLNKLDQKDRQIFTTLLPYMASMKKRKPELSPGELIEEVKRECVEGIEKTLKE